MPTPKRTQAGAPRPATSVRNTPAPPGPAETEAAALIQRARHDPRLLSARDVPPLQRLIGNQAVGRRLAGPRGGMTAPPSAASARPAVEPAGRPPEATLQHRVGFEFESGDWRVYREFPSQPRRRAGRKEVVHSGDHFQAEGDDAGVNANLEFVTDPLDATPAGLAQLNRTMRDIRAIAARLDQHSHRRGVNQGGFLGWRQHRFNRPFVKLSAVNPATKLKMQATQGVALEDIPTMMRYFGIEPGEGAAATAERRHAREMMYGSDNPANAGTVKVARLIGTAPARAEDAINHLVADPTFNAAAIGLLNTARPQLRGFLAQVIVYVKGLIGIDNTENELKYNTPLMARTNFAALYELLPAGVRQMIGTSPARIAALSRAVAHGASQGPIFNRPPAVGGFYDANLNRYSAFIRRTLSKGDRDPVTQMRQNFHALGSLTIQAWISGIVHGVDRLTAGELDQWLAVNEPALAARQRELAGERLESFASLGRATDPGTNPAKTRLAMFENRFIGPEDRPAGNLDPAEAHQVAYNYLEFFVRLAGTAVGGNPGNYANVIPPP